MARRRLTPRRALGVARAFSDDTLGYFTERLWPERTRQALAAVLRQAKRNKGLDDSRFLGLALDGTAPSMCAAQHCPLCRPLVRENHQVLGYRHELALISLVGDGALSLPFDLEPYGPGDSEYAASQRLLKRAVTALGPRFADYVVADGEYATAPFLHGAARTVWSWSSFRARSACAPPSMLIPIKPGERIKTDWRDTRKLAELLRAGLLTEVQAPNEADEALRDLCRGRDSVRQDLMRARHRMRKFLLRRGYRYHDTQRHWGVRHMTWLRPLAFEHAATQATFDHSLLTLDHHEDRRRQMDAHLETFGDQEPYRRPVAWLRCFRGIDTVTAVSLVAELHDFRRFRSARAQERLHSRFVRMTRRGIHYSKVVVAMARELVGYLWATLSLHVAQTRPTS